MPYDAGPLRDLRSELGERRFDRAGQRVSERVGGAGTMPDQPLEITAPGEESGTYDAFIELSGIPDFAVKDGVAEDDSEAPRGDYTRRGTTT